jgi:HEAT repeat protein
VPSDSIDAAIGAFVERGGEDEAEALRATGEAGLRRMLDLWFRRVERPADGPIPALTSRWLADQWSECLGLLAETAPTVFVDGLTGHELGTDEIAVLGGCKSLDATRLLCAHGGDADWLIRYNVIRSLIRIGDVEGRECIEAALADEHLVVRSTAIKGVSRWDPERAEALYKALLTTPNITPLLRQQAEWAIQQLRAGNEVRDPLDPI